MTSACLRGVDDACIHLYNVYVCDSHGTCFLRGSWNVALWESRETIRHHRIYIHTWRWWCIQIFLALVIIMIMWKLKMMCFCIFLYLFGLSYIYIFLLLEESRYFLFATLAKGGGVSDQNKKKKKKKSTTQTYYLSCGM